MGIFPSIVISLHFKKHTLYFFDINANIEGNMFDKKET